MLFNSFEKKQKVRNQQGVKRYLVLNQPTLDVWNAKQFLLSDHKPQVNLHLVICTHSAETT